MGPPLNDVKISTLSGKISVLEIVWGERWGRDRDGGEDVEGLDGQKEDVDPKDTLLINQDRRIVHCKSENDRHRQ